MRPGPVYLRHDRLLVTVQAVSLFIAELVRSQRRICHEQPSMHEAKEPP